MFCRQTASELFRVKRDAAYSRGSISPDDPGKDRTIPSEHDQCRKAPEIFLSLGIGKRTGVRVKGPTPLPVKRLNVVTRKAPCGNGTETYEKWEMRMHRRIIDLNADDKAIRQLMRLKIPDDVYIELSLK